MLHIYLDESGDLGLNLEKQSATKYFVVSILVVKGFENNRLLINAVKKTIKRKLNPKNKRKRIVAELKGTKINLEIKKYFYNQLENIEFDIYSIVVKKDYLKTMRSTQTRLYNYISRTVLNGIDFNPAESAVHLIVDKSKTRPEIKKFNDYIKNALEGKIKPSVQFHIRHMESFASHGLQAADLFCHGIFERYERNADSWYKEFEGRIKTLLLLPE
jgi:hypothetical protein